MDDMDVEPSAKRPRLGSKSSISTGNDMDLDHHLSMESLQGALPPIVGPNNALIEQRQNPHNIPVDNWAGVMRFLAFPDMLGFSSTARYFLRDVAPLVRKLTITDWSQMHPCPPGRRFSGMREIDITCLFEYDGEEGDYALCQTTTNLMVKFLSAFPKIRRAWAGGISPTGDRIAYDPYNFNACDQTLFATQLVANVCQAYRAGKFSQDLHFGGLVDFVAKQGSGTNGGRSSAYVCPMRLGGPRCPLCRDICHSFPVLHVMKMGQGIECLSFETRLDIVAARPGGLEAITLCAIETILDRHKHDPLWIVKVDSTGRPCGPASNGEDRNLYRVDAIHYSTTMIEELEVVMRFGVDTTEYNYSAIEEHLPIDMSELDGNGLFRLSGRYRGKLYITESTYNALVDIGMDLNPTDFRCIVRSEEAQMFSMGGLLSLERLPGSVQLLMDTDV